MDRWTDGKMDVWTNGQVDGLADRPTDRQTYRRADEKRRDIQTYLQRYTFKPQPQNAES